MEASVTTCAVIHVPPCTWPLGRKLPSGVCQERTKFHDRSSRASEPGVPWSARVAYVVGSSQDCLPQKYPQPPSEFWVLRRKSRRDSRYRSPTVGISAKSRENFTIRKCTADSAFPSPY